MVTNTVIIMTSNIGTNVVGKEALGFNKKSEKSDNHISRENQNVLKEENPEVYGLLLRDQKVKTALNTYFQSNHK